MARQLTCSAVWSDRGSLIHPPACCRASRRRLPRRAFTNGAAVNTCAQVSAWTRAFRSFGDVTEERDGRLVLQECVSLRQTPENRLLKRPRCTALHPRRRDMSAWRCRGFGVRPCTGRVVAARRRFNLRPPKDVRCGAPLPERLCHPLVFSGVTLLRLRGSSHIRGDGPSRPFLLVRRWAFPLLGRASYRAALFNFSEVSSMSSFFHGSCLCCI